MSEQKLKDSVICHRSRHEASQCKFRKAKCNICGKDCVCKSGNTQGSVKTVEDTGDRAQQQYGLYNMESAGYHT